jgi:alpha-tubulin suppressor-like RCC1 family protein
MKKFLLATLLLVFILSSCSLVDSNFFSTDTARKPDSEKNNGNAYGIGNGNAYGNANGNGNAYGWGNGYDRNEFNYDTLSSEWHHTLILDDDGIVWATGFNPYGQIGDGTTTDRNTLFPVMNDVIQISAGEDHSLIQKSDGTIWSFGDNQFGQLGDGTFENRLIPVQVIGIDDVIQIVAGPRSMSLFLKNDGSLWASGTSVSNEMGNYTYTNYATPVMIDAISGVKKMAVRSNRAYFILEDGSVVASGYNSYGELGDGTTIRRMGVVVEVVGIQDVIDVYPAYYHTLFLKEDGTVWAVGRNDLGQLGLGHQINQSIPIQIPNLTDVIDIDGGRNFTIFNKSDGSVWISGTNYGYGIFGTLSNTLYATPVTMNEFENIVEIDAGNLHIVLLDSTGDVWTMGVNYAGQLGDGSNINKSVPTQIMNIYE